MFLAPQRADNLFKLTCASVALLSVTTMDIELPMTYPDAEAEEVLREIEQGQSNTMPQAAQVQQPMPPAPLRKRLRGKQAAPLHMCTEHDRVVLALLAEAMDAEEDEEAELAPGVLRQHVHFTHVTTQNPEHKQPNEFTRQSFFEHLLRVFKDVYPDEDSPTGSILAFGCVAKEWAGEEHNHGPTFCRKQYYWNKVAKRSLQAYGVPLNAKAHRGYFTMYAYLRCPTARKPLSALDAQLWHSEFHPSGQALVKYLQKCKSSADANAKKEDSSRAGAGKRKRLSIFEEIREHKLETVTALQAHALKESVSGNGALAEYCIRNEAKLEDVLAGAWSIMGAPSQLKLDGMTLMDKLVHASKTLPCECDGRWAAGAAAHLQRNSIDRGEFCAAVLQALRLGAGRGSNVACIGEGGCGKSTLLEPLEKIFNCAPKPEKGSTFSLFSLLGYDILLWQDHEHREDTLRFSDLLSFLMGESVGVRRAGTTNRKVRNRAPCFYSGRARMHIQPSAHHTYQACQKYNGMMDERFCTFVFSVPIPKEQRQINFPMCGRCAAKFYLEGEVASAPVRPMPDGTAASASSSLASELQKLADLYGAGVLDADEFKAAKRQLLHQ